MTSVKLGSNALPLPLSSIEVVGMEGGIQVKAKQAKGNGWDEVRR